jgi:preprotein translocase subunit SecB
MPKNALKLYEHPMRLLAVVTKSVTMESNKDPYALEPARRSEFIPDEFSVEMATVAAGEQKLWAFLKVETKFGQEHRIDDEEPYLLRVELAGLLQNQGPETEMEQLKEWAIHAAYYLLAPHARELIATLTTRSGWPTLHLPLVQFPAPEKIGPLATERSTEKSAKKKRGESGTAKAHSIRRSTKK